MDWERILKALGLDTPRWRWRLYRWQQQREAARETAGETRGGPGFGPRPYCEACRAIVDPSDRTCPYCGARLPSARARFFRRLGLVMPAWCAVTPCLIAANVGVLLVAMALFGGKQLFQPTTEMLYQMGALVPAAFRAGQYWTAITYGYLHIGLMHIAFNLFALSQVGPVLEQQIGRARFFTLYTLALLGGAAADVLVRGSAMVTIAGASGALFGCIGFGMAYGHFYGGVAGVAQRNFFLKWAAYGFLFGLLVGADNIAHGGGFAVGAALGYVLAVTRADAARWNPLWNAAALLCLLLTLGAFAWLAVVRLAATGT